MQQNYKTCSHCRQVVLASSRFCPNCGTKFLAHIPEAYLWPNQIEYEDLTELEAKRLKENAKHFNVG